MKDIELIEKIVVERGRIVNYDEVKEYLGGYGDVNKKISSLISKGFLVSLRKGVYYVAKLGSLGYASVSSYLIANAIGKQSFVSFEAALKYHGFFDQGLKRYRSIAKKQYLEKELEGIVYQYVTVKEDNYFGFDLERVDGGQARIATKERALLDLIEYKRSINSVSLVLEKLADYGSEFDDVLMKEYLTNCSQVTVKSLGLLLDLAHRDSSFIEKMVNQNSTSKMLSSSQEFSNKWRLYYDQVLVKQVE